MSLTQQEQLEVGVLLPLHLVNYAIKKEDIMNNSERRYFNTTVGRKEEEWVIQNLFKQGVISRIRRGYYQKNPNTKMRLEQLATQVETIINEEENNGTGDAAIERAAKQFNVLNIGALTELRQIYRNNEDLILARQAALVRQKLFEINNKDGEDV